MFEWLRHWRFGKQYGYERFFRFQDLRPEGKTGIILSDLGMPEDYKRDFYINFMNHVFEYSLPSFVRPFVLADRGIALIDPANPLAREKFIPFQLVDMNGSFRNRSGRPYVECEVVWRPPGMKNNPADHGYFLYTGDGKGGAPDVCQKTAAKVAGWYYGHLLPEKKIAWEYQCRKIYQDTTAILKEKYPDAEFRHIRYAYDVSINQSVGELLSEGCKTIIYQCFCNPVYSDFEDYSYAIPKIHAAANGKAKIICADQLGNQPSLRLAYIMILRDHLDKLPDGKSILLILSRHGHPFKKDTLNKRAPEYRVPLESEMRNVLKDWKGRWEMVWSDDEYADEYWDPGNKKLSTFNAYRRAIREGYEYALEIPTDFVAENTDLMILHAMKKFNAFGEYDSFRPVSYPDWDIPLVRTFHEGKTTGIYTGCPVGPYRKYVVEAAVASVSDIIKENDY